MPQPGQNTRDALLASWRTPRLREQGTAPRQVLHQRFRASPLVLMVESGRVTSGVGANGVAATCTWAFALGDVAGKNTYSTRAPAAVSPDPRAPAGQRGCRLLR
jgi:hypothetical protein